MQKPGYLRELYRSRDTLSESKFDQTPIIRQADRTITDTMLQPGLQYLKKNAEN